MDFDIKKITIEDKTYPEALRRIKKPPKVLYYAGRMLSKDEFCFAIVGSRIPSLYGKQVASSLGNGIAKSNLTIVSGLAKGIDSIAHTCAVSNSKRTVAVLGGGIDYESFYPKENLKLAKQIIENDGLIVSEYPIGTKPSRYSFPDRNRIIAGLSVGVMVVEAKAKSGSLITAEYAKEQQKEVFAVPNSIYDRNSKGCLELIKNGANLIESIEDIFIKLKKADLPLSYKNDKKEKVTADSENERIIIEILSKSESPLGIEALIKISGLPTTDVIATITILEIKNKVVDVKDRNYLIK